MDIRGADQWTLQGKTEQVQYTVVGSNLELLKKPDKKLFEESSLNYHPGIPVLNPRECIL